MSLPLGKPVVRGFMFYAFPLAILANHPECESWILSNYIQTYFDDTDDSPVPFAFYVHDFAASPWLRVQDFQRETLSAFSQDPLHFILQALDNSSYVYLYVDEYFIPDRRYFQEKHFCHEILINGFDLHRRVMFITGYCRDSQFKTSEVSFDDFEKSYHGAGEMIQNGTFDNQDLGPDALWLFNNIKLYTFRESGHYEFNLKLVRETLKDYLYSRNTSERYSMVDEPWTRRWGLDWYPCLKRYYQRLIEGEVHSDWRHLHTLWEHKVCMVRRMEYMEKRGIIDPGVSLKKEIYELEYKVNQLRLLMIKYTLNKQQRLLESIIQGLDEVFPKEVSFTEKLLLITR